MKTRIQSPKYEQIYKHQNGSINRALFRGLYQGVGSIILITIPSSGAFFTTYEALKYFLNDTPLNSTLYVPEAAINAVSSGGAELVSCAILTPAEVLKQNAQMIGRDGKKSGISSSWQVLKQFKNNPSRLFRGYTALAARNLPFTGLQFPVFEHLKKHFLEKRKVRNGGKPVEGIFERASITAMSASMAGSGAAWITTPIDVVKTRIMLAAGEEVAASAHVESGQNLSPQMRQAAQKSGWTVAREIFRTEGVRGMFRGGLLRSAWTAVGSGLYLGVYEGGRFYLEGQRKAAEENEGESLMQKDWKNVKVGIGKSRSQDVVRKSAWQDD